MGWTWDHTKTRDSRSYTSHEELGAELRRVAPRQDWAAVQPLFGRGSGDQFDVQPGDAARMATALAALAELVSPTWTLAVRDLAACAREAGRTNSLWHWS